MKFKSATGRLDAGMHGATRAFYCASLASCRRLLSEGIDTRH